jgi:hypothetical protein
MGFDLLSMRTRGLNTRGTEITAGYRSGMLPDRASGGGPDRFRSRSMSGLTRAGKGWIILTLKQTNVSISSVQIGKKGLAGGST